MVDIKRFGIGSMPFHTDLGALHKAPSGRDCLQEPELMRSILEDGALRGRPLLEFKRPGE